MENGGETMSWISWIDCGLSGKPTEVASNCKHTNIVAITLPNKYAPGMFFTWPGDQNLIMYLSEVSGLLCRYLVNYLQTPKTCQLGISKRVVNPSWSGASNLKKWMWPKNGVWWTSFKQLCLFPGVFDLVNARNSRCAPQTGYFCCALKCLRSE